MAARGDLPSPFGLVAAVVGGVLALLSAVMAIGLWTLKPWARFLQIAVAAIGLLDCPMTLASATVLVYMLRKPTALWFSGRNLGTPLPGGGGRRRPFGRDHVLPHRPRHGRPRRALDRRAVSISAGAGPDRRPKAKGPSRIDPFR